MRKQFTLDSDTPSLKHLPPLFQHFKQPEGKAQIFAAPKTLLSSEWDQPSSGTLGNMLSFLNTAL